MKDINLKRSKNTTIEWYTPKYIIEALGDDFDLGPCAPCNNWYTAKKSYTKEDNGLLKEWFGRVFLNPPYTNPILKEFVTRLADHGNGIALLYARVDNKMFHEQIFNRATSIKFLCSRIKFIRQDGSLGNSPGYGSVLVAYGKDCDNILKNCSLKGKYIKL